MFTVGKTYKHKTSIDVYYHVVDVEFSVHNVVVTLMPYNRHYKMFYPKETHTIVKSELPKWDEVTC